MITGVLASLVATGLVFWLAAAWAVERFFHQRRGLGQASPELASGTEPAVSVLKPVKGMDTDTYENFASFCRQRYPRFELLFGVDDPQDPAAAVVGRLRQEFPALDIRCVVAPRRGWNPKSSILRELVAQSRYPVLAISDGDIRVGSDYLARIVPDLTRPSVGLVTCLYRNRRDPRLGDGDAASSSNQPAPWEFSSNLERLYLEGDFLPSVVMAHRLFAIPVGLGATIAVRREDLDRAGGYAAIADYLADDYFVAASIAGLGLRTWLSDYIVEHGLDDASLRNQWDREVRWARGIRAGCPRQYWGLLLKFPAPAAAIMVLLNGTSLAAWGLLLAVLLVRWLVTWRMQRHLGRTSAWSALAWLPVRDCLTLLVWCTALLGGRIRWRGQDFSVEDDGRLGPARSSPLRRLGEALVRGLDFLLRRAYGIREFNSDQRCICRFALAENDGDVRLADGTWIASGETIGELHLWNEHMPPIPETGVDLRWAADLKQRVVWTLQQLADYCRLHPELQQVRAWRATPPLPPGRERPWIAVYRRLGFDAPLPINPSGFWARSHDLGEDLLLWALAWAINPTALKDRQFRRQRYRFWMSQSALAKRYEKDRKDVSAGVCPDLGWRGGEPVGADDHAVSALPGRPYA